MPLIKGFAMAVAALTFLGPGLALGSSASPAEGAYYQIEEYVFEREQLERALATVAAARESNPSDPWVYLGISLAVLVSGYNIGDWYSLKTFEAGTIDKALSWAEKARALDARNSQVHAHIARLLIVKGEYDNAWKMLVTAHDIAPESFYPWYFRGIIAEKKGDSAQALSYFVEAEKRTTRSYQRSLVNIHRQTVAKQAGDVQEQERLLKDNIARNPDDAHYYGNYAHFLKKHKRYDESIYYWKKAIALSPYPHAVQELEETKRLKAQAAK